MCISQLELNNNGLWAPEPSHIHQPYAQSPPTHIHIYSILLGWSNTNSQITTEYYGPTVGYGYKSIMSMCATAWLCVCTLCQRHNDIISLIHRFHPYNIKSRPNTVESLWEPLGKLELVRRHGHLLNLKNADFVLCRFRSSIGSVNGIPSSMFLNYYLLL